MAFEPKRFEDLFRRAGVELGHALARRILDGRAAPVASSPPEPVTAAAAPRILPGLPGRRRRAGEAPPRCGRAGCNRASRTRGYCQTHYVQWLKAGMQRRAV
jgi:hypothetical protein